MLNALLAISTLAIVSSSVEAKDYSFYRIADTDGEFSAFRSASINTAGEVAFHAEHDDGGQGIYVGDGKSVTVIADTDGPFKRFSSPRINMSGTVVFSAGLKNGGQGIYTGKGGALTKIADNRGERFDYFQNPNISDNGTVVFFAASPIAPPTYSSTSGIYISKGGNIRKIAGERGEISSFGTPRPVINAHGTVAFGAELDSGEQAIFTANEGTISKEVGTLGPFDGFADQLGINALGAISFFAGLDSGGYGIFTSCAGSVTPIVDPENRDAFGFLDTLVALNSKGVVPFRAIVVKPPSFPIEWTLNNVRFEGGGSATGTFVYDADLGRIRAYSDASITTSGVTGHPDTLFSWIRSGGARGLNALEADLDDYTGHPILVLGFERELTNEGGKVPIRGITNGSIGSYIATCRNVDCSDVSTRDPIFMGITGGSVIATDIPDESLPVSGPNISPGGIGIFTGEDPIADKVIIEGEILDGRTVVDVWPTYHQSINDSSNIVFRTIFSDGSEGVYIAYTDSEPPNENEDQTPEETCKSLSHTLDITLIKAAIEKRKEGN